MADSIHRHNTNYECKEQSNPEYINNSDFKCKYSRLSLSRIPRYSLEHFEISVLRNIRVAEVRKTINRTTTFNKWICNLTPEVRGILKILWNRGELLLFPIIFCYLFLDFHVKTGTRISLRDKRLLEISEVEITRVDCIGKLFRVTTRHKQNSCNINYKLWFKEQFLNTSIITTLKVRLEQLIG